MHQTARAQNGGCFDGRRQGGEKEKGKEKLFPFDYETATISIYRFFLFLCSILTTHQKRGKWTWEREGREREGGAGGKWMGKGNVGEGGRRGHTCNQVSIDINDVFAVVLLFLFL